MKIEPKMTLKMDPKSMPKPTKGGQGPPQGAPGGDFDSFWSASRTSRDQSVAEVAGVNLDLHPPHPTPPPEGHNQSERDSTDNRARNR